MSHGAIPMGFKILMRISEVHTKKFAQNHSDFTVPTYL